MYNSRRLMVSWYTSTLPPEFNEKNMYEENQGKFLKHTLICPLL